MVGGGGFDGGPTSVSAFSEKNPDETEPASARAGSGSEMRAGWNPSLQGAGMRNWFVEGRLVATDTVPGILKREAGRLESP